jgi:hypothetical protein
MNINYIKCDPNAKINLLNLNTGDVVIWSLIDKQKVIHPLYKIVQNSKNSYKKEVYHSNPEIYSLTYLVDKTNYELSVNKFNQKDQILIQKNGLDSFYQCEKTNNLVLYYACFYIFCVLCTLAMGFLYKFCLSSKIKQNQLKQYNAMMEQLKKRYKINDNKNATENAKEIELIPVFFFIRKFFYILNFFK